MSKSNRIKGAFDKVIGCRASSPERIESLALRTTGITERHAPTPREGLPKMTKRMRKAMRNINKDRTGGSADGYMFIMGLLTKATNGRVQAA